MTENIINLKSINDQKNKDLKSLIETSEKKYKDQVKQVVNAVIKNDKYKIILLSGPSSSGKTTTSNYIRDYLSEYGFESLVISLDDFFLNREQTPKLPNGDYDFENITALDLPYLNEFVDDMFTNGYALMPTYNFVTGKREKELKKIEVNENTIIIFEGIHALNPDLIKKHRDSMLKVYICASSDFVYDGKIVFKAPNVRLMRRLSRDSRKRGITIEETFKMWKNVLDGEVLYIDPYKNSADIKIVSTIAYEPLLFASFLLEKLEKSSQNEITKELINALNLCETLPLSIIPENSLLNEFLN